MIWSSHYSVLYICIYVDGHCSFFSWQVLDSLTYNRLPTSYALFQHNCSGCACCCQVPQHAQGSNLWNQLRMLSGFPVKNSWLCWLETITTSSRMLKWVYLCTKNFLKVWHFFYQVSSLHLQSLVIINSWKKMISLTRLRNVMHVERIFKTFISVLFHNFWTSYDIWLKHTEKSA